jgi:hypothetical protein
LAAIAAVVEEVALVLNKHAPLVTGEEADGEVIGESARGDPDGHLLSEVRSHRLFQFGDYTASGVIIRLDGGGNPVEKRRILRRGLVNAISGGSNEGTISSRRSHGNRSGKDGRR